LFILLDAAEAAWLAQSRSVWWTIKTYFGTKPPMLFDSAVRFAAALRPYGFAGAVASSDPGRVGARRVLELAAKGGGELLECGGHDQVWT